MIILMMLKNYKKNVIGQIVHFNYFVSVFYVLLSNKIAGKGWVKRSKILNYF